MYGIMHKFPIMVKNKSDKTMVLSVKGMRVGVYKLNVF